MLNSTTRRITGPLIAHTLLLFNIKWQSVAETCQITMSLPPNLNVNIVVTNSTFAWHWRKYWRKVNSILLARWNDWHWLSKYYCLIMIHLNYRFSADWIFGNMPQTIRMKFSRTLNIRRTWQRCVYSAIKVSFRLNWTRLAGSSLTIQSGQKPTITW